MKAVITGASSGLGLEMARYCVEKGMDVVLVARSQERLAAIQVELGNRATIEIQDLADSENCYQLFDKYRDADILINNAGFAVYGEFTDTSLEQEIGMLNVNVMAPHILMKLYLQEMTKRNGGYILNIASGAVFTPGPLLAAYASSKSYLYRLTQAVHEELRNAHSNVFVSVFCPGPIHTNFGETANVRFNMKYMTAEYAARKAIDGMLCKKAVVIPNSETKMIRILAKLLPSSFLAKFSYKTPVPYSK